MYYYGPISTVAGAMRLPNPPKQKEKTHYLTDYYAKTKFDLNLVPFNNFDDNAFLKYYNMVPTQIKGIIIMRSLTKLLIHGTFIIQNGKVRIVAIKVSVTLGQDGMLKSRTIRILKILII